MNIIKTKSGQVLGVHSWTTGFVPTNRQHVSLIHTEWEAERHALYLERTISSEVASEFLDWWLAGVRCTGRVKAT